MNRGHTGPEGRRKETDEMEQTEEWDTEQDMIKGVWAQITGRLRGEYLCVKMKVRTQRLNVCVFSQEVLKVWSL